MLIRSSNKFIPGQRVRIADGSGIDSRKLATVATVGEITDG
jgi:hypothetical protein